MVLNFFKVCNNLNKLNGKSLLFDFLFVSVKFGIIKLKLIIFLCLLKINYIKFSFIKLIICLI